MRKAAVLLVCTLAVLFLVGASLVQSLLVIQRIAAVRDVAGTVELQQRGTSAFLPLGATTHVRAGDVLRTGADGAVTLNWVDGSRIRLGPNTKLVVLKCQIDKAREAQSYLFKLDVGQVWVRVLQVLNRKSKFEIQTPTATAAVRGTVFSVKVGDGGDTTVSVLRGEVELAAGGRNLSVKEREEAAVARATPAAVRPMTPEGSAEWDRAQVVAQPALTVDEPTTGKLPPNGSPVTVSGSAERGAKVTVNGKPVTPNLVGKFTVQLPVPRDADEFEVTARATDSKGFETVVVRRLSK